MVGEPERKRRRHRGTPDPELLHRAQGELQREGRPLHPLREELVLAELLERDDLEPGDIRADAWDLERVERHRAPSVALEVEERVRDDDRHLVPKLRRANGVSVDEDVGHGAILTMRRMCAEIGAASDVRPSLDSDEWMRRCSVPSG